MSHYKIDTETTERLENTFKYHAPFGDQQTRYTAIREVAKGLAFVIIGNTPKSREQSLALTKLEETIFFANAAIARNEKNPEPGAEGFFEVKESDA